MAGLKERLRRRLLGATDQQRPDYPPGHDGEIRRQEGEARLLREPQQGDRDGRGEDPVNRILVEGPQEYAGVSVAHPRIREAVHILTKKGYGLQAICEVVGMPGSVVQKYMAEAELLMK